LISQQQLTLRFAAHSPPRLVRAVLDHG
jgi:hypothetical protein